MDLEILNHRSVNILKDYQVLASSVWLDSILTNGALELFCLPPLESVLSTDEGGQ